jgi:hypothetical protein
VPLVRTDVSEEPSASIIRLTIGELRTLTYLADSCYPDNGDSKFLRNVGSYKSHRA